MVPTNESGSLPETEPGATTVSYRIDDFDLERFVDVVEGFGVDRFGYVVTPNVDHLVRLHEDEDFRSIHADASYVLLDSRFAANLLRLFRGVRLPVCTGSDLTAALFEGVVKPSDRIVLIGSGVEQARTLEARFGLRDLRHFNPPMGFIRDPEAVEACLRFIEAASPFRFCLIAVGTPQGESLAQRVKARRVARGLALCIGASIDFLTGAQQRAPLWMRRLGFEWLYRLGRDPRRLAVRYLIRSPRFFAYQRRARIELRPATARRP
jgi:exopolysaccharide biosynthesis WecB/TagA/CpsF family protein